MKEFDSYQKIMVTGSRNFPDQDLVYMVLNKAFNKPYGVLIHGNCPTGADEFAHKWALSQPDVYELAIDAKWNNYHPRNLAGPHRNQVMIDLKPDVVLAFYATGSANKGTQDAVSRAESSGIQVIKYGEGRPDSVKDLAFPEFQREYGFRHPLDMD